MNSKISVAVVSIVAALVFLLASGSIVGSYYQAFARGHHSYHGHHYSYHGHHSYYGGSGPNGQPGGRGYGGPFGPGGPFGGPGGWGHSGPGGPGGGNGGPGGPGGWGHSGPAGGGHSGPVLDLCGGVVSKLIPIDRTYIIIFL